MFISSANAVTPEEQEEGKKLISDSKVECFKDPVILSLTQGSKDNYSYKIFRVKTTDTYIYEMYGSKMEILKKNGTYQRKSRLFNDTKIYDIEFRKELTDIKYQFYDFDLNSSNHKFISYNYEPAKKGDRLKVYDSSTKTSYQKGIIYEIKPYTLYEVINPNKAKKIKKASVKTFSGYYKTYKMPTLSLGKYKNEYFKGENFTYGNSNKGYYINPKNTYSAIYKITPTNKKLLGKYLFYKKPTSFTIYVNR